MASKDPQKALTLAGGPLEKERELRNVRNRTEQLNKIRRNRNLMVSRAYSAGASLDELSEAASMTPERVHRIMTKNFPETYPRLHNPTVNSLIARTVETALDQYPTSWNLKQLTTPAPSYDANTPIRVHLRSEGTTQQDEDRVVAEIARDVKSALQEAEIQAKVEVFINQLIISHAMATLTKDGRVLGGAETGWEDGRRVWRRQVVGQFDPEPDEAQTD